MKEKKEGSRGEGGKKGKAKRGWGGKISMRGGGRATARARAKG